MISTLHVRSLIEVIKVGVLSSSIVQVSRLFDKVSEKIIDFSFTRAKVGNRHFRFSHKGLHRVAINFLGGRARQDVGEPCNFIGFVVIGEIPALILTSKKVKYGSNPLNLRESSRKGEQRLTCREPH